MLTAEQHVKGAEANVAFATRLARLSEASETDSTTIGWAITALFYAAVHALRGYLLHRHDRTVTSHDDMKACFARHPELRAAQREYDRLKQHSHATRYYLAATYTWADFHQLRAMTERLVVTYKLKVVPPTPAKPEPR